MSMMLKFQNASRRKNKNNQPMQYKGLTLETEEINNSHPEHDLSHILNTRVNYRNRSIFLNYYFLHIEETCPLKKPYILIKIYFVNSLYDLTLIFLNSINYSPKELSLFIRVYFCSYNYWLKILDIKQVNIYIQTAYS